MKQHTAQHEPVAATRLRCRLLAPLMRAGEIAQSLVAARNATACTLRARLAKLTDVSGTPTATAATAAGRLDPRRSSELPVREHRFDTDPATRLARGDGERPTQSTDKVAPSPVAAENRTQSAASDLHADQASVPRAGHERSELSPAQRAALEATARRAAEDALRPVRDDHRALANDVRAYRAEPPAFQ